MSTIRLALVGLGKIARDQHLPAIAQTPGIELVAIASRNAALDGIACYPSLDEMLAEMPDIDAVALCTPPQVRRAQAASALEAGKHVLLEKPPGATVSEIAPLVATAEQTGRTLFATWHSRFAPAVEPARAFLAQHAPRSVTIEWKEDVRVWHPGQDWIWEPGGLGVFDPGINALSIATAILPFPLLVESARIDVPAGRASPIAAKLAMRCGDAPVRADFDFLQTGLQTWDIEIDTDAGMLRIGMGGSVLQLPGEAETTAPDREYPNLYARFADLIAAGQSDVDISPLRIFL